MITRTNPVFTVGGVLAVLLLAAVPLAAHGQGHEGEDDHGWDQQLAAQGDGGLSMGTAGTAGRCAELLKAER
jgi:hypothetical protein